MKHAERKWLCVLGHKQDVRTPLLPYLLHEFRKTACVREVQHGVGFGAMPVAAGHDELVPTFCIVDYGAVFLPTPHTTEFKGMNEHP
jgi:hypothetical protein